MKATSLFSECSLDEQMCPVKKFYHDMCSMDSIQRNLPIILTQVF